MSKLSNLEFFKLVAGNGDAGSEESRFIYPPAIDKTLGFELIDVGPGTATMELVPDAQKHANPMGTIHGGVLCDIADAAIGTAHATTLDDDESFTSIDLQINFFRPVWNGRIRAVAKPGNVGSRISRYVCDIVKEIGSNVTAVQGDVSKLDDLDRLFAQIKQEKGKLDIVFANAGIANYAPLGQTSEELFDSIFDINVKGTFFTVQKALPLLSDGAAIIVTSYVVGSKGLSSNSAYSATKAALRSFARTWTTDLKLRRIRVNAVSPGTI